MKNSYRNEKHLQIYHCSFYLKENWIDLAENKSQNDKNRRTETNSLREYLQSRLEKAKQIEMKEMEGSKQVH